MTLPERRVTIQFPDLPWKVFRAATEQGQTTWTLAEVLHGDAHGYELHVPDHPTADELRNAMAPFCGRPIADTLVEEVGRRMPGALGGA